MELHHDEEKQEEDENDFQGFDLEVEDDKINDNDSSTTSDNDATVMATAETSDAGTTHTTNKASRKPSGIALAFAKPDVSPEDAEEYIKKHVMPDAMLREGHWRIKEAPKFHVNRSRIWTYGVMYDRPAVGSMTAQRRWFCLATETCRIGNVSILPGPGATGNCNIHLRSVHNIVSVRSKSMSAKKAQDQEQLRKGGMEKMKMIDEKGVDGGQRYDKLNFVKYVVIGCFQPFNYLECSWMRHHYKQLVPTIPSRACTLKPSST